MDNEDMQWCPGLRQVDLKPVDEKLKFLFILGAQKAGTTWLHRALMRHPIFVEAERGYMCAILTYRVHTKCTRKPALLLPPRTTQNPYISLILRIV